MPQYSRNDMKEALEAGAKAQHAFYRQQAWKFEGKVIPEWEQLRRAGRDAAKDSFNAGFSAALAVLASRLPVDPPEDNSTDLGAVVPGVPLPLTGSTI